MLSLWKGLQSHRHRRQASEQGEKRFEHAQHSTAQHTGSQKEERTDFIHTNHGYHKQTRHINYSVKCENVKAYCFRDVCTFGLALLGLAWRRSWGEFWNLSFVIFVCISYVSLTKKIGYEHKLVRKRMFWSRIHTKATYITLLFPHLAKIMMY